MSTALGMKSLRGNIMYGTLLETAFLYAPILEFQLRKRSRLLLAGSLDSLDDLLNDGGVGELQFASVHLKERCHGWKNSQSKYHRAGPPHRPKSCAEYDA